MKYLSRLFFFLCFLSVLKCGKKNAVTSNNSKSEFALSSVVLPCDDEAQINRRIYQISSEEKHTYGLSKFISKSSSDTLFIRVDTITINKIRYRKIIFSKPNPMDSLILNDKEPHYAFSSVNSSKRFLLFSNVISKINFGEAFNLEYDLEYLSLLTHTKIQEDTNIRHYIMIRTKTYLGFDTKPRILNELYVDGKMNILGAKFNNIKCVFFRTEHL
ncbi:MAG: hypothetical protein M3R17_08435 [Bacteroidota bacterium]|nr:hypothetical protein [Bacteroidota bacterium]